MKLSPILLSLTLATSIVASPIAHEEKRDTTVPGTISTIVSTLSGTVNTNLGTINGLVGGVKQNADSTVQAVTDSVNAIKDAFILATNQLVAATTGGVGGIAGAATGFTKAQLLELLNDVQTVRDLINAITVSFTLIVTNLTPAAVATLTDEIDAVKTALSGFTTPLFNFVGAVQTASASLTVLVSGVGAVVAGLGTVVASIRASLLGF